MPKTLTDSRIPGAAAKGPIDVVNVAYDSNAERWKAAQAMLKAGEWSSITTYLDVAGPALHLVRSPSVGPIRPARIIT